MIDPASTIPARLGITHAPAEDAQEHVFIEPYPHLVRDGVVAISVWALMADMLGGWMAENHAGGDWVFTTDLSVRAPVLRVPGRVAGTARSLRVGRANVSSDVVMHDETGALFAYAQLGFVRMPRRPGDRPKPDIAGAAAEWGNRPRIDQPLDDAVGIRVVDAAKGVVHVELGDELRNPAGAMQGAMVALVGERAAAAAAVHHLGHPQVVTDLDVRYLAMGRVGPVRSRAAFVGPPTAGTLRVELRDHGNGDRLMTAVLARTTAAVG